MRSKVDFAPRDTLVLAYHAVSSTWPAALAIEPERLDSQLSSLVRRGYRPSTFTDAVRAPRGRKQLVVTFDDGLRSVIERALPILDAHGVPGTVFAPTAFIDRGGPVDWPVLDQWLGGPHEQELLAMSWSELRLLAERGWEIGSHTRLHPHLPRLGDQRLNAELAESRRDCEEHLGLPCRSIAYPYGEVDRRVARAARRAGYLAGAALPSRIHRRDLMRWPRVGVWRTDPAHVWELKASPSARRRLDFPSGEMKRIPQWRVTE